MLNVILITGVVSLVVTAFSAIRPATYREFSDVGWQRFRPGWLVVTWLITWAVLVGLAYWIQGYFA